MFGLHAKKSRMLATAAAALATLTVQPALAQSNGQGNGLGGGQGNAQPNCGLVVESGPQQWTLNFDPLTQSAATQAFDLAVVNRGSGPCTGVVSVELRGEPFGLALNSGGTRIPYSLVDERGGSDVTPKAGESPRRVSSRPINLGAGEREPLRFTFTVSSNELLTAGLYSQSAFVLIEHPNGNPWAEMPVTLGVRVTSAAMMGLKGEFQRSGGLATIDLGRLTEGVRPLNTTLYVLSTSGYAVSVSSENAGRLRQGSTEWYVPYSLAVGDRSIDLSQPRRIEVASTRSRADNYPLSVQIGSVTGRRAGDYSDIVTFTIAAI